MLMLMAQMAALGALGRTGTFIASVPSNPAAWLVAICSRVMLQGPADLPVGGSGDPGGGPLTAGSGTARLVPQRTLRSSTLRW